MTIEVLISPSPHVSAPLRKQIRVAIRMIAKDFGWDAGQLSIAILDDASIQEINRKYLSHDYPTDVISFDLTDSDRRINGESRLEGEILVSWETAARVALEQGWQAPQEILLYVIHGMLHIVGLDDHTPDQCEQMRRQERHYMRAVTGDATNLDPAPDQLS